MADGVLLSLPIQSVPDSGILSLQIGRVRLNSGDTDALQYDIRLDSDDSDAPVEIINVPGGTFVKDVGWFVHTAFTASNTFLLGDSADADGYASAAAIGSTTADANIAWMSAAIPTAVSVAGTDSDDVILADSDLVPPYSAGKVYLSTGGDTDMIELTIDAGASPAAGLMSVYVMYFQGWGRPKDFGQLDTALFA